MALTRRAKPAAAVVSDRGVRRRDDRTGRVGFLTTHGE
ncbi:hypothetical protein HSB1_28980 [Halogranum salarium B-1]|uniref:Uncharacterized protein n=1 Tax=Halogranum salarium B-1 TaxID=1210908 RepID=J3EVU0_9EURY|nr:hypothetical protein HSB1_28980 [Halogranum salarium B-1]